MAEKIEMPRLSDTMEEGVIAKWNVKEGDKVSSGDIIAEVETDKATMEVEVFESGTILKILVAEGDAVPLAGLMAVIGEEGEDISALLEGAGDGSTGDGGEEEQTGEKGPYGEEAPEDAGRDVDEGAREIQTGGTDEDGRNKASPRARKIAEDKGISLGQIEGSGPDGRIVKKDVEDYKIGRAHV